MLIFHCRPGKVTVTTGQLLVDEPSLQTEANAQAAQITAQVQTLVTAINSADSATILRQVHPKKGAYIDLKAPRTYAEIKADLENSTGLLTPLYWDEDELARRHPDGEMKTYRSYFRDAGEIRADLFFASAQQCEVLLEFENRPSLGLMGNPVYQKIEGHWYLLRLL